MNWRTTAVLFVVLAGLVGFLVWQNQQEETAVLTDNPLPTVPATPVRTTLISTTNDGIEGLTITNLATGENVLFVQTTLGEWQQTEPTESAVISDTLNTAVAGLLNLTSTRTLNADENPLSAYGLDEPSHQISVLVDDEGTEQLIRVTLLVGDETAVGSSTYVQKEGDGRVHLLPAGIVENLLNLLIDPPLIEPTPPPSEQEG